MTETKIEKGKKLVEELAEILRELPDKEVSQLLDESIIDTFLNSVLDRAKSSEFPSIIHFLLANKTRASLLAQIRHIITHRYSFYGEQGEYKGYCSPEKEQWYEDGVMILSGSEPFSGYIGLFRENEMKYAIAAKDINPDEEVEKDSLEFLSIREFNERFKAIPPEQISDLDKPIRELQELLDLEDNDESKYQLWLEKYPWILGLQYDLVEGHRRFDDENIPDFTGRKVIDATRDVIEIKPPFVKLFNNDGSFSGKFSADWSQTKRYLNFANEEKDYLRRKGLTFENPKGYLVTGYNLSEDERRKLRIEERYTSMAQILTWDELFEFAKYTVEFVKRLKGLSMGDEENS